MAIDINNNQPPQNTPLKQIFKILFLIFGGMFGALFSIIYIVSIFDNIIYSNDYTYYDGQVIKADPVESYIATTYRYKKSTTGKKYKVEDKRTCYRQDLVVTYNDTTAELEDISTDIDGYTINENVPIYVKKSDPSKVTIHANVSDKTYLYKGLAMIGIYWLIYAIILITTIKKHKQKTGDIYGYNK